MGEFRQNKMAEGLVVFIYSTKKYKLKNDKLPQSQGTSNKTSRRNVDLKSESKVAEGFVAI